ncbi:tectonin domain-containing protein [Streptomyces caeruleatus]|uniref:NlpC/P60 domain-containing protein n=1 Tax=Streptomyces caeruleatus TaxID=661399 RepID=A0A101TW64_9ACTN|nr:tectonin domain-containing protein [Streptomyces caeruleatus]KUN99694.1 hypothetical protein AQJ67_25315 [Streptomyces caeruleatus]
MRTTSLRVLYGTLGAVLLATTVASEPVQAQTVQAGDRKATGTGTIGRGATPGGRVTREQIIERAQAWVAQRVPYSSNGLTSPYSWWSDEATGGHYRQDCSGFVSMAWQLPYSRSTSTLREVSSKIDTSELKPGDILNSDRHVLIFGGWTDRAGREFTYYQQSSRKRPANRAEGDLDDATLSAHPTSSYEARRYHQVIDTPTRPSDVSTPPAAPPPSPQRRPAPPTPRPLPRTPAPERAAPHPATRPTAEAKPTPSRPTAEAKPTPSRPTARQAVRLGPLAAHHRRLYALAEDRSGVYERGDGGWRRIGGPAGRLYAGGAGVFATNPKDGRIFKYGGTPGSWTWIGTSGAEFTIGGNTLYGLTPKRDAVLRWTGSGSHWTRIGGPARHIHGGGAGLFATDPGDGRVRKFLGRAGAWKQIGGMGLTFAVDGRTIHGISPDGSAVYRWTGYGTTWVRVGGPAVRLYAGWAGVFATNPKSGDLYRFDGSADSWTRVGGPGATFTAGADGELYGLSPDGRAVFRWTGRGSVWTPMGAPTSS